MWKKISNFLKFPPSKKMRIHTGILHKNRWINISMGFCATFIRFGNKVDLPYDPTRKYFDFVCLAFFAIFWTQRGLAGYKFSTFLNEILPKIITDLEVDRDKKWRASLTKHIWT